MQLELPVTDCYRQKHHSAFAPRLKHFSRFEIPIVRIKKNKITGEFQRGLLEHSVQTFFLPHDKLWLSALKVILAALGSANLVCDEKQNGTLIGQFFYLWINAFFFYRFLLIRNQIEME